MRTKSEILTQKESLEKHLRGFIENQDEARKNKDRKNVRFFEEMIQDYLARINTLTWVLDKD